MKFFSINKKPNLLNIGIFSLLVLIVLVLLLLFYKNALLISIIIALYLLIVIVLLFRAFILQLKYNPYSYNTIFYSGFSLFLLSILIMVLVVTRYIITNPEAYDIYQILSVFHSAPSNYMLLSFPFILVLSVALFISNISLITHEGYRFVNILGIILSFLLVLGEVLIFWFNYYATGSMIEVMIHDLFNNLFSSIYLYFECILIGTIISNIIVTHYKQDYNIDFIIILGCAIRNDGTPTPLLRSRIDRAIDFSKKQFEATGKEVIFITSGGQGSDEVIAESTSMKNYLLSQGIKEDYIIEENKSTNTFENMQFSKKIIDEINSNAHVAYATNNYHVFRSGIQAKRNGLFAVGIGAKTKWYFWPNAAVREFVGLIANHRLKQSLILISLILISTILTLINYLLFP